MKTEEKVVYPAVKNAIEADAAGRVTIHLMTNLRKKGPDGNWYLYEISKSTKICDCFDVTKGLVNATNNFHNVVYREIIAGVVDTGIIHYKTKEPFYRLDDNQVDEKERIAM